jgi:mannose-6-phosphate isomerase-like protein (cupin superfamily)
LSAYVVGQISADAAELGRGGWIVGSFFEPQSTEGARHCADLEVKYWHYSRGGGKTHGTKSSSTTEWSFILQGKTRAVIGNEVLELNAGSYVLIHPNTPNNLVSDVLEDVIAITVKAPSDPQAKRLL